VNLHRLFERYSAEVVRAEAGAREAVGGAMSSCAAPVRFQLTRGRANAPEPSEAGCRRGIARSRPNAAS